MSGWTNRRLCDLQNENQRLRDVLRKIDELAVPDGRPDRYVVPALHFDAAMREAGLRPDSPEVPK